MPTVFASVAGRDGGRRDAGRPRRRLLAAPVILALLAWSLAIHPTAAGVSWCRSDPVVLFDVGGRDLLGDRVLADVFVAAPVTILTNVTGPNQVAVTTPNGVDAVLALGDLGFGRGETVTFVHSAALRMTTDRIEIEIAVYVPARADLPVEVSFAPRVLGILWPATAAGRTNQWIVLRTVF